MQNCAQIWQVSTQNLQDRAAELLEVPLKLVML
jgi:hypothetical protein